MHDCYLHSLIDWNLQFRSNECLQCMLFTVCCFFLIFVFRMHNLLMMRKKNELRPTIFLLLSIQWLANARLFHFIDFLLRNYFRPKQKCSYFVQRRIIGVDFYAEWKKTVWKRERVKRFAQQNNDNMFVCLFVRKVHVMCTFCSSLDTKICQTFICFMNFVRKKNKRPDKLIVSTNSAKVITKMKWKRSFFLLSKYIFCFDDDFDGNAIAKARKFVFRALRF